MILAVLCCGENRNGMQIVQYQPLSIMESLPNICHQIRHREVVRGTAGKERLLFFLYNPNLRLHFFPPSNSELSGLRNPVARQYAMRIELTPYRKLKGSLFGTISWGVGVLSVGGWG